MLEQCWWKRRLFANKIVNNSNTFFFVFRHHQGDFLPSFRPSVLVLSVFVCWQIGRGNCSKPLYVSHALCPDGQ